MKTIRKTLFAIIGAAIAIAGCRSVDTSIFGGSFGRNSSAMTAGGAVAGQDYVIGLRPSEAAQQYFASASASDAKTVTVTPGDDKGTGVVWTDDGGIVIPPGTTIEFTNKGCCLDPHLPAPKADEEMQFIKTSCLIPTELQGTYKNLLRRAAAGDEDVKSNLQHLMWTLRTAGSNDAYAKNLTDRQREILAECAEAGSFDGYCQDLRRFAELKKFVMAHVGQAAEKLQIEVGNVTYKASDLLDPELGKQKVAAHLGELIHMNEYLPVVHSGFNYGELQKGIYTDIKGNGTLSFKAKVANSTSEPFVFYPMDYVAQVGSGQNMQGAFFAAADSSMKQRTAQSTPEKANVVKDDEKKCKDFHRAKQGKIASLERELDNITSLPKWFVEGCLYVHSLAGWLSSATPATSAIFSGGELARTGINDLIYGTDEGGLSDFTFSANDAVELKYGSKLDDVKWNANHEMINLPPAKHMRWMRPEQRAALRAAQRRATAAAAGKIAGKALSGAAAYSAGYSAAEKYDKIQAVYRYKEQLQHALESLRARRCPICGGK